MKVTNKISSFIGGVVIAFAITLFLPSAANATWSNYHGSSSSSKIDSSSSSKSSHSSSSKSNSSSSGKSTNNTKKCVKYKKLAYKYLKAYYRCYNYRYYQWYVYYMKKYKQCQSTVSATPNCNKYKDLANRYLAAYYRCGYYCYYQYYCYYLNLYKKCEANLNKTGKVCGQVFEDSNDNGVYDSSDKRLANVTIKVTDSKGKVQSVTTNNKGYYCASNVAVGTASIDIDESTLPDNPTQVVGTDPTNVTVKVNCKNWEERNGYTFPIPTGKVCGTVYEDINENGQQDNNETGQAGIIVKLIDANGEEQTETTNDSGKYCFTTVVEGSASIEVDETTLPQDATLTAGENPNSIDVEANTANQAGTDGYTLPTPVGSACGHVLVDGQGQAGVTVTLMDSEGNTHSEVTNADGKYCFTDIPQGTATVDVDDTTLPDGAELTSGEDPSDVNVLPNTENDAGTDAYTLPIPVGTACGSVIVDGEGASNVTVNIVDINGESHPAVTDDNGTYCVAGLPEGEATVTVDETTLPFGVEQTLGLNPSPVTIEANKNNDAGIDGYETKAGSTCGVVVIDSNANDRYETTDTGIEGVTVTITDAKGEVYVRTTDANGLWCVNALSAGNATADADESTLPAGAEQVFGMDPSTVYIIPGAQRTSGADGYVLPQQCPAGFESLQMEIFTRGMNTADNLQTVLPITIPDGASSITFKNVQTSDANSDIQPYEQFKIITVDTNANLLAQTRYTTDIDNVTHEDEFSDLGTLSLSGASEILLVHRADPVYGDNLPDGNSVTFKSLCYKIEGFTE